MLTERGGHDRSDPQDGIEQLERGSVSVSEAIDEIDEPTEDAEAALTELWTTYAADRDPALRDRLILHYAPLVKYVAGRVGSGLTQAELAVLEARFAELATDACPFEPPPPRAHVPGATWLRPELVVEVEYAEWTSEGRLRHPTYAGRRIDKDAADVTAEP